MPTEIFLQSPLDMHIHFREGAMLDLVAPLSAETFAGGVIMPNLVPPVADLERLEWYTGEVRRAVGDHVFTPYMALFFRNYSEADLAAVRESIIGIKLYPEGVTTNSEGGVKSVSDAEQTMAMMQDMDIPLLVHGEVPESFVMDRESDFLPTYDELAQKFPRLKIIMEHITTAAAVKLLDRYENVHATVTLQHLLITLDDVAGGLLNPHLFCKPIAKRPEDRDALLHAALTAHPKLMFGSDSAPHPLEKKECCGCAAGVFTAPVALAMLAELFDAHDALDKLQAFVSGNAQSIYGLTPPAKTVHLVKEPCTVPAKYGDVVPIRSGGEIGWRVV
ncbi:MAG: dihydroorotase [Gemmatimonadetes bacterium]|jgi:dihydroorotase|nr:dihydroorotase [Gemmatimonadota bacterium]MDE0964337.1 dihydroorotase [Candidatus Latescibacterota bacterium]MBT5328254.1 dihydroorotase [Gemmatimonadota bacterium]MBT5452163.1 dihydroorotase [Gemmatimonadota bacterium]MBT5804025.1 dihydroorotase [Gemmatimonadota bacterium]